MKNIPARSTGFTVLALLFASGAFLSGCEEGPVEEAGEEIDQALDEAEDAID